MDTVRVLDELGQPTARPPAGWRPLPALLVLAVVAVALVAVAGTAPVRVPEPPALPFDRDLETGTRFHYLLGAHRPDLAVELLAEDWTRLDLPGMPRGFVRPGSATADVVVQLDFYRSVVAPEPGECTARAGRLTGAEVVCATTLASPWVEAAGLETGEVDVTYQVVGGRIAAIGADATPGVTGLCHWAERQGALMFDTDCLPLPGDPPALLETAAGYVEAGRPEAPAAYLLARRGAGAVYDLVRAHNHVGDTAEMRSPGLSAAGAPGLVGGGPAPLLAEYLAWSQVAYRIDLGACSVDGSHPDGRLRVVCPDAAWTGPLVAGLTLDVVVQPVTFGLRGATVRGLEGGTAPGLVHAFDRFCEWVHDRRPEAVPYLFTDGCRPIYTAAAAGRLLTTLGDYKEDAR